MFVSKPVVRKSRVELTTATYSKVDLLRQIEEVVLWSVFLCFDPEKIPFLHIYWVVSVFFSMVGYGEAGGG